MTCDLSFIVRSNGVCKVSGSHIHFRSGVSEAVLDRNASHD